MKSRPDSLTSAVREFRELTETSPDGSATRARVLAGATRGSAQARVRRLTVNVVALTVAVGSAAVASTTIVTHRAPTPVVLATPEHDQALASLERPAHVRPVIPAMAPDEAMAAPPPADGEATAYGAAHAAHFAGGQPERALAAWNDYLRVYPGGRFAPEARFNRAICLVRLRRLELAAQALQPFAHGRYGAYRRAEAVRLLDWLSTGGEHRETRNP
jgi:TolA-binding protein